MNSFIIALAVADLFVGIGAAQSLTIFLRDGEWIAYIQFLKEWDEGKS